MLLNNLEAPLIYHNNQKDASFKQKPASLWNV